MLLEPAHAEGTRVVHLTHTTLVVEALCGEPADLHGEPDLAVLCDDCLEHARALGFPETAAWCCEGLALVAAELGHDVRAARLLGAGESLRRAGGGVVQPAEAAVREAALATISRTLPMEQVQAALDAGRSLSLDEAATEAIGTQAAM